MYRALLLDFYGTLVAEDDALVARIAEQISAASCLGVAPREVSHRWNRHFTALCGASHGAAFRSQREIESASLAEVAAIEGISIGAVKVRLHRARRALRDVLENLP